VLQAALASMEARKKQLLQSTNSAVPWFGDAYVSRLVCNWHWFEEEGV
jgi:hypothetical protein